MFTILEAHMLTSSKHAFSNARLNHDTMPSLVP